MWGLVGKSDYMIDDPPTRGSAVLENQILIVPRDLYLLERIEEFRIIFPSIRELISSPSKRTRPIRHIHPSTPCDLQTRRTLRPKQRKTPGRSN